MTEDESSSDLEVQLEWPQGEEPGIDVGASAGRAITARAKGRSRALERVRRQEVPPGVKALADRIDGLAHSVTSLDARLAEQVARLDEARDQTSWDSERILAKLDVLREATDELRRVRDHVGALVERRARRDADLQTQLTELANEVHQLSESLPRQSGANAALGGSAVGAIADAVSASLAAKKGSPAPAKKASRTPAKKASRTPAKKASRTPAKKARAAATRKR